MFKFKDKRVNIDKKQGEKLLQDLSFFGISNQRKTDRELKLEAKMKATYVGPKCDDSNQSEGIDFVPRYHDLDLTADESLTTVDEIDERDLDDMSVGSTSTTREFDKHMDWSTISFGNNDGDINEYSRIILKKLEDNSHEMDKADKRETQTNSNLRNVDVSTPESNALIHEEANAKQNEHDKEKNNAKQHGHTEKQSNGINTSTTRATSMNKRGIQQASRRMETGKKIYSDSITTDDFTTKQINLKRNNSLPSMKITTKQSNLRRNNSLPKEKVTSKQSNLKQNNSLPTKKITTNQSNLKRNNSLPKKKITPKQTNLKRRNSLPNERITSKQTNIKRNSYLPKEKITSKQINLKRNNSLPKEKITSKQTNLKRNNFLPKEKITSKKANLKRSKSLFSPSESKDKITLIKSQSGENIKSLNEEKAQEVKPNDATKKTIAISIKRKNLSSPNVSGRLYDDAKIRKQRLENLRTIEVPNKSYPLANTREKSGSVAVSNRLYNDAKLREQRRRNSNPVELSFNKNQASNTRKKMITPLTTASRLHSDDKLPEQQTKNLKLIEVPTKTKALPAVRKKAFSPIASNNNTKIRKRHNENEKSIELPKKAGPGRTSLKKRVSGDIFTRLIDDAKQREQRLNNLTPLKVLKKTESVSNNVKLPKQSIQNLKSVKLSNKRKKPVSISRNRSGSSVASDRLCNDDSSVRSHKLLRRPIQSHMLVKASKLPNQVSPTGSPCKYTKAERIIKNQKQAMASKDTTKDLKKEKDLNSLTSSNCAYDDAELRKPITLGNISANDIQDKLLGSFADSNFLDIDAELRKPIFLNKLSAGDVQVFCECTN